MADGGAGGGPALRPRRRAAAGSARARPLAAHLAALAAGDGDAVGVHSNHLGLCVCVSVQGAKVWEGGQPLGPPAGAPTSPLRPALPTRDSHGVAHRRVVVEQGACGGVGHPGRQLEIKAHRSGAPCSGAVPPPRTCNEIGVGRLDHLGHAGVRDLPPVLRQGSRAVREGQGREWAVGMRARTASQLLGSRRGPAAGRAWPTTARPARPSGSPPAGWQHGHAPCP